MADDSMAQISSTRGSIFKLSPPFSFSILAGISLLIWWHPLTSSFRLAFHDDQYTHILLILPLTVAMIYLDWESSDSSPESAASVGIVLLVAAAVASLVARFEMLPLRLDEQLSLNMLALVLWWIGAFLISFGARAFQRALFPLCFLLWIVPIPEFVLNPIVGLLQQGSVAAARVLFAAVGVPTAQDGTQITIPGLTIEVARECSSIRSSLILVVTTMVLA